MSITKDHDLRVTQCPPGPVPDEPYIDHSLTVGAYWMARSMRARGAAPGSAQYVPNPKRWHGVGA